MTHSTINDFPHGQTTGTALVVVNGPNALKLDQALAIAPANNEAVAGGEAKLDSNPTIIRRTNKPRTLDEVVEAIATQEAGLCRERFPASELRVEGGRVIAGDKDFHL